jgi:long-chain fatty acid transport protein
MEIKSTKIYSRSAVLLLLFACATNAAHGQASGALENGVSGRAAAIGGATVASVASPLEAMQGNPATLTQLSGKSLDLSVTSLFATGNFTNSVSSSGNIVSSAGTLPYGGFSTPLGSGRWRLGIAVAPDTLMTANWKYLDPPGGVGGASYGLQQNKSAIIALRSSAGLGFVVNRKLSIGGTVGAVYNSNTLQAPYIFQEQPQLAGLKTLLDLHTSGVGWNGSFGALISPNSKLQIGLAYKTRTTVTSRGNASGNASAQFAALGAPFRPDFHYNAEVDNKFPQAFSGGVSWRVHQRARLNLQGNWINWSNAFERLPVKLTNGNNSDINSFVGSNSMEDFIPLHWRDQGVFGAGVESPIGEHFSFRGGYSYATNPVPSATLTPMTAAILQNTIGTGIGYGRGHYALDLSYQVQLPSSAQVMQSSLKSGEYNNSRVEVAVHSVTLSNRIYF